MANFQPSYMQPCPCMGGYPQQMQQQPSFCFNPCQSGVMSMPPPPQPQQGQFQCIPMPPLWNPMQGQPAPFFNPIQQCMPPPSFQADPMGGMPNIMMPPPQPYVMLNGQPQQMQGPPQQFGQM